MDLWSKSLKIHFSHSLATWSLATWSGKGSWLGISGGKAAVFIARVVFVVMGFPFVSGSFPLCFFGLASVGVAGCFRFPFGSVCSFIIGASNKKFMISSGRATFFAFSIRFFVDL
jgi:hypothetical protein